MKRICISHRTNLEDSSDKAIFDNLMYHGESLPENGVSSLYKNLFESPHFIKPNWNYYVDSVVKEKISQFNVNIDEPVNLYTFNIKPCEYSKYEKKYPFEKFNKRIDFYKNLPDFQLSSNRYYCLGLYPMWDMTAKEIDVNYEIKELKSTFRISKIRIPDFNKYDGICYYYYSFFKHEFYECIRPYIDENRFIAKEINLPF